MCLNHEHTARASGQRPKVLKIKVKSFSKIFTLYSNRDISQNLSYSLFSQMTCESRGSSTHLSSRGDEQAVRLQPRPHRPQEGSHAGNISTADLNCCLWDLKEFNLSLVILLLWFMVILKYRLFSPHHKHRGLLFYFLCPGTQRINTSLHDCHVSISFIKLNIRTFLHLLEHVATLMTTGNSHMCHAFN